MMKNVLHDDDDDLAGINDDGNVDKVEVQDGENSMEDDIDPLDAYMAEIEAEVKETMRKDTAIKPSIPKLQNFAKDDIEDEDEVDTEVNAPKLETAEEILALAQKVAKRKDITLVDHSVERYEPFRKNFYIEAPSITSMTDAQAEELRASLDGIKVRGKGCPRPVQKWTQCGLDGRILEAIKKAGYDKPTPIQAQAIPAVMSGRDLIGIAKTGSGKTVAFLLPMLRHILDQRKLSPTEGPISLILTPTRELAMQIWGECQRFGKVLGVRTVCACGGAPIKDQIGELKRGAEVLVATPGRLIELLVANSGRVTNLKRVTYLVMDEADRMFDLGFGPQVLKIVGNVRPDRQAVLFSATFPRQMEALARKVLTRPLEIVVGDRSVVCEDVTQRVEVLATEDAKFVRLLEILGEWYPTHVSRILIFVDRQDASDMLLRDLLRRGYPCLSIHGGKDQADRDSAIADFKSGVTPILVATSVAARGLDVKELGLVINYDAPNHMEDYVHRVGRTGRAGAKGTAYTFLTPNQSAYAVDISRALKASGVDIPEPVASLAKEHEVKIMEGAARANSSGFGGKGLERIDQEHERTRKVQKRSALGDDVDVSDDEEEATINVDSLLKQQSIPQQKKPTLEQAQQPAAPKTSKSGALPKEALEAIRSLNEKLGKSVKSPDVLSELNKKYENMGIPTSDGPTLGEVIPIYGPSSTTAPDEQQQPRSYFCELDINDFPQQVRWRITHKDTVGRLLEYSGCSIVIRGEYIPPGKVLEKGQRRLHMRLDAEMYASVDKARAEVRRLLHEYTVEAAAKGSIDFSRYEL